MNDNIADLARILAAGENYINTSNGILTVKQVEQLIASYIPGGDTKPPASQYELVGRREYYSGRNIWYICERQTDGTLQAMFDVGDPQEGEYFLSHPTKIIEQCEHQAHVRKMKKLSEGKSYVPPQKGYGKKMAEAKAKPIDPEEAAASGFGDDLKSTINQK